MTAFVCSLVGLDDLCMRRLCWPSTAGIDSLVPPFLVDLTKNDSEFLNRSEIPYLYKNEYRWLVRYRIEDRRTARKLV